MKKLYAFIITISLLLGAACDKAKTLKQIEDVADELRIHNKNIAKTANEFHSAGKLSDGFHKGILTANDKFSTALDGADKAIVAAKAVTTGTELKTALDYAERFLDTKVFSAFTDVVAAVVNVPPEIKEKIEIILASIRGLFATLRIILGEANPGARKEVFNAAG